MGVREMGRHWCSQKRRKVPALREIKRVKAKISEVCSPSESEINEQISKNIRRAQEACRWKYWSKAKNGFNLRKKEKIDEHAKHWGIGS